MDKLKEEFIRAIMMSLKIDNNPFIIGAIDEFVSHIKPQEYAKFINDLFGTQHAYLNGIDRVAKVAETFKTVENKDEVTLKAEELIKLVYAMNDTVFENAKASGRTFDDELQGTRFIDLDEDIIAILNQVKPYTDYKSLVSNISRYSTSLEQLRAFKNAIEFPTSSAGAIECSKVRGLLK